MFTTTTISPLELHLDENNPRFRININPSQDDIRKYMIKHEKLLVLANSMTKMNTLLPGERVIIYNDGEKNIVLEGNRRTSVYQLLLNRSLIPSEILRSFPIATEEFLLEISNIPVDVVKNRKEAMAFLAARHIVGVEKWSSVSKWKVSYEYYKDGNEINEIATRLVMSANTVRTSIRNYKVLLRGINSPNWTTDKEKSSINPLEIKPDKLIRILGLKDTSERLGLFYSENHDLLSNKYDETTITNLVTLLTKMAFITGEVDTRTSINEIWDKLVSVIPELDVSHPNENDSPINSTNTNVNNTTNNTGYSGDSASSPNSENNGSESTTTSHDNEGQSSRADTAGSGGKKNVPYFFDGLKFGNLNRKDSDTHGVTRVCIEITKFSDRRLVDDFPIAAAFLTRSLIEQSLTYYAKTHPVQGQEKSIWDQISRSKSSPQLSDIIQYFNRNLSNYITDKTIRDYFTHLFKEYKTTADPLNWVIHRPYEFVIQPENLIKLPGAGLLSVINYLLA